MKKILLIVSVLIISVQFTGAQTTATNFNCNDCDGNNHDLFSELDAGKVVVIAWVMPCGSCIGPAKTAYGAAQSFETSNPGRVLYYLSDDYANTSCATMNSWASTNGMPNAITISNSAVDMADYGTAGMPKVVVLGGPNHTIYLNKNSGVTNSNVTSAITNALAATGINDNSEINFQLDVFPNPVIDKLHVTYSLLKSEKVKLEIVNLLGETIKEIANENQTSGKQELNISTENINSGVYFLKLTSSGNSQLLKFVITH